jgi:preprotein translocase subunit YajC
MPGVFLSLLLNTPATPGAPGASSFLMMLLFALAFWFLMIAPQRKKQKQQEKMISALKEGDEILTTSGLFARVVQVENDWLLIKTGDSKLELHKNFVQSKITDPKTKTAPKSGKK